MAGYSGTPLVKKLGIKPGARVQFLNTPRGFEVSELVADAKTVRSGELDFALLFVNKAAELKKELAPLCERVCDGGMVWVSWPKKASGVPTDVTEDVVRQIGLPLGWADVKVCAIDEIWSGLKFYRRKGTGESSNSKLEIRNCFLWQFIYPKPQKKRASDWMS